MTGEMKRGWEQVGALHRYRVWVSGKQTATTQIVEAQDSFSARLLCAGRNGVKTYECVSVRLYDDES